jgi:HK97 family phage prohead protease
VNATPTAPEVRIAADTFELREVEQDGRFLRGRAAPLGSYRDVGPYLERLDPAMFDQTLQQRGDHIPLMMTHDHENLPIGSAPVWEKSDDELIGTWRFDSRAAAREAYRLADERVLTGLSVGFLPGKARGSSIVEKRDGVTYVDRRAARLLEVSLVAIPAYEDAHVLALRTAGAAALEPYRRPRLEASVREWDAFKARLGLP